MSVVMVAAVVMAAVASPFDEPQHLLRATEESPDLADVHVLLAFFRTTSAKPCDTKRRAKSSVQSTSYFAALASGLGRG
jgi:hypothetical protein